MKTEDVFGAIEVAHANLGDAISPLEFLLQQFDPVQAHSGSFDSVAYLEPRVASIVDQMRILEMALVGMRADAHRLLAGAQARVELNTREGNGGAQEEDQRQT